MSQHVDYKGCFQWHENEVQDSLQLLHNVESGHLPELAEIVADLIASPKYWQMSSRFTDALDDARKAGDRDLEHQVLLWMFARMYTAGSLRKHRVLEDLSIRDQE